MTRLSNIRALFLTCTLVLLSGVVVQPAAAQVMPKPAGLESAVGFWRQVFAEVTTDQALAHDNRHLGVVYEKVDLPASASSSKRRRIFKSVRGRYKGILNRLADGKRSNLTSEEARVLSLWPENVTNKQLRQAAGNVRLQQGLADRFHAGLIRSGQWRDFIHKQLADAGVPQSLSALPHVESSFNPKARSHVGASGMWQFTRPTGRRFMQIDYVVDERNDPFLSSEAAAKLLQYNYSILKSWPLAITAYNHGVAGMRRAVKNVGTEDIDVIVAKYKGRAFGFASRNFYVAFLGALEVEQNAEQYFGAVTPMQPRQDLVVALSDYYPLAALGAALGVSSSQIGEWNPALMPAVLNGSKYVPKGFQLRLPADSVQTQVSQVIAAIPSNQRFARQTPDQFHKVERGDSLSVIAARYRTSISELVALNGLRSRHQIRAGQVLRLPFNGTEAMPLPANTTQYIVRRGDTLGGIASRAGMSETDLMAYNSVSNRNKIYPGQVLRLAGKPVVNEPEVPVVVAAAQTQERAQEKALEVIPEPIPNIVPAAPMEKPVEGHPEAETQGVLVAVDEATVPEVAEVADPAALLADPGDYLVDDSGTIEVQAAETLGHYADWLGVKTQRLRDWNGFSFRKPVVIGQRLKLKFGDVDKEQFVQRRLTHHRELQEVFFGRYHIVDTTTHTLKKGESIWILTLRRYKIPVWLLRQYNPDMNFDRVKPGAKIVFPQLEAVVAMQVMPDTGIEAS